MVHKSRTLSLAHALIALGHARALLPLTIHLANALGGLQLMNLCGELRSVNAIPRHLTNSRTDSSAPPQTASLTTSLCECWIGNCDCPCRSQRECHEIELLHVRPPEN
jgi:hypothetical protein